MRKVFTTFKSLASLGLTASLALAFGGSCGSTPTPETMMPVEDTTPAPTINNPPMAFDHDGTLSPVGNAFADGQEVAPAQAQYMHACGKITFPTLARILKGRGYTIPATTPAAPTTGSCPTTITGAGDPDNGAYFCTVGDLYNSGNLILGIANLPARAPEDSWNSTGGIVRLQDILIAAAEATITTTNPDGSFTAGDCAGTKLFNGNTCQADGFACYMGVPLTPAQLNLCNQMLTDSGFSGGTLAGDTKALVTKRLTLASISSSIYLCD